jgi:plasmid stabilization system protein ParE
MPSYFWRVSPRLKKPAGDDVPYTTQALRQDLLRLRNAWNECQARRDRDAIYGYLTAVFNLVAWWAVENRALERACKALRLQNIRPSNHDEPFASLIRCTADPRKVDRRTRSKWSRVLRYVVAHKPHLEPLEQFIKRKGGINECATRSARHHRRYYHEKNISAS